MPWIAPPTFANRRPLRPPNQELTARDQFQKLALEEPDVEPLTKAKDATVLQRSAVAVSPSRGRRAKSANPLGMLNAQVVQGDLLRQPVEVIVNSWNRSFIPYWLLLPQGVSGAIRRQAGSEPFRQVGKKGLLPVGAAVLTGAGRLPYKGIIHVAGLNSGWTANQAGWIRQEAGPSMPKIWSSRLENWRRKPTRLLATTMARLTDMVGRFMLARPITTPERQGRTAPAR